MIEDHPAQIGFRYVVERAGIIPSNFFPGDDPSSFIIIFLLMDNLYNNLFVVKPDKQFR